MRVSEPGIQESPDLRGGWSGLGPGNSAPVTEFCIFPPSPALCSVTRGHPESTGVAPAPIPGTMWQGQQITAAPHPAWSFCLVAPPVSPNVTDSYSPIKTQLRLYLESFWLPHHQAGGGGRGDSSPPASSNQWVGRMSVFHTGLLTLPLARSLLQQTGTEHQFCTDTVELNKGIKSPAILQFVRKQIHSECR